VFDVGHEVTACTDGLFCAVKEMPDHNLMVIDCEGTHSIVGRRQWVRSHVVVRYRVHPRRVLLAAVVGGAVACAHEVPLLVTSAVWCVRGSRMSGAAPG
jgi:hypothetical protein